MLIIASLARSCASLIIYNNSIYGKGRGVRFRSLTLFFDAMVRMDAHLKKTRPELECI